MRRLKWAGLIGLLLLTTSAILFANFWYFKPLSIHWFYQRVFLQFALDNPETLTNLRLLEPLGITAHNARLNDYSPQGVRDNNAFIREQYAVFKRYPRDGYNGNALLSYDVFDHFLSQLIANEPWQFYDFPVNQLFGVQSSLPNFMTDQHIIESEHSARQYIARLHLFPQKFGEVLAGLKLRQEMAIIPPRFTVKKTLAQMREFIEPVADEHFLYTHFIERLDQLEAGTLSEATRDELQDNARQAVEHSVYPAYQQLIAYLDHLLAIAHSNDGVWRLPRGDAFYASRIRQYTTTEMSAEKIHRLGLQEVDRISDEMDTLLIAEGLTGGSIGNRIQRIAQRPDQRYPNNDDGRRAILADYQTIIDEINRGIAGYFNLRPDSDVEVVRIPEFAQETAPGAYYESPSLDGARPGRFFVNLRDLNEIPRFSMRTLAYHEAVPGHHFQLAIAQSLNDMPTFRRLIGYAAYSEGWALYAEQLAWEAGFQQQPLDNLGRLQAEMFRAVRLVVDTGLHAKRWTREQAIDYMQELTGMSHTDVVAEIERYLVLPGQALSYKIGMLKILAFRQRAQQQLGARFDLKAFHDQILGHGAVPLNILEQIIDQWLARQIAAG